tara:strand:+ start:231 stop:1115 length:885 start_codon:yes stop_codon:yes gene_type:complete
MDINRTVLVTGANGFTGRFVCKNLKKKNIPFIALIRPKGDISWMENQSIDYRFADLNNTEQLSRAMKDCTYLLNIASIGFGSAPSIIKACEKAGISRAVFISTTSIYTKLNSVSKGIRLSAENSIKKSNLKWTILRPTMIYGTGGDRNMIKLIRWIDKIKVLPVFGDGRSLQQPIFVEDLAWSIVEVLHKESTYRQSFNLSGEYPISFKEVINNIETCLNKKVIRLYLPAKLTIYFLRFIERIKILLPIKAEQIERLNEDKDFKHTKASKYFNFSPMSFKKGINLEVRKYLEKK